MMPETHVKNLQKILYQSAKSRVIQEITPVRLYKTKKYQVFLDFLNYIL